MKYLLGKAWQPAFANSNDAFVPEVWAQESLMILENEMLMPFLVHRDFENEIAQQGDIVNTRLPADFEAKRKVDGDAITNQDATSTNVAVPLDQHLHTSFIIYDGEESKGFKSLRDTYLVPAVISIAQAADEIVIGEMWNFLQYSGGKLGTAPSRAYMLSMREQLNNLKCPQQGRRLVVSPGIEADLLNIDDFTHADKLGDDGTAMREASMGRKYGFDLLMSQNMPDLTTAKDVVTGAVNNAAGEPAGDTGIVVNGFSAVIANGTWCTIAGDMTPQLIVATVGGTTVTSMTIWPGLKFAVANTAVVTLYDPGAVNFGAGYAAGWTKPLVVDSFTLACEKGQMLSQGASAALLKTYGLINTPTITSLTLNRALETALSTADPLFPGPNGSYGFAFHRNAVSFVNRPLAPVAAGSGALSYVANYNGVAMRVTITYDADYQGHRITVDMLCGVKTLDTRLGALLYG